MSSAQPSSFSKKFTSSLSLTGVRFTDRGELDRGSDAVVVEADHQGTLCAAKKLHQILLEDQSPGGAQRLIANFENEITTWYALRHPHIVLLLGVHFEKGSRVPTLILEKMQSSLRRYIETYKKEEIPLADKVFILCQVSQALAYLHSRQPPLVHHDLSPNNILLNQDSLLTKITDFGMSRVVDPSHSTHKSSVKGTVAFMSPEALVSPPKYTEKLDIFSFGNVVLFTITHLWPEPGPHTVYKKGKPVTAELQRREQYTSTITAEERSSFFDMIRSCLENRPERRPTSLQLLQQMRQIEEAHPRPELTQQLKDKDSQLKEKDDQLKEKDDQLKVKDDQVKQKDGEKQQLREENQRLQEERDVLKRRLDGLESASGQVQEPIQHPPDQLQQVQPQKEQPQQEQLQQEQPPQEQLQQEQPPLEQLQQEQPPQEQLQQEQLQQEQPQQEQLQQEQLQKEQLQQEQPQQEQPQQEPPQQEPPQQEQPQQEQLQQEQLQQEQSQQEQPPQEQPPQEQPPQEQPPQEQLQQEQPQQKQLQQEQPQQEQLQQEQPQQEQLQEEQPQQEQLQQEQPQQEQCQQEQPQQEQCQQEQPQQHRRSIFQHFTDVLRSVLPNSPSKPPPRNWSELKCQKTLECDGWCWSIAVQGDVVCVGLKGCVLLFSKTSGAQVCKLGSDQIEGDVWGVAFIDEDTIVVSADRRLRTYTTKGQLVRTFGSGKDGFDPRGLTVDPDGRIFVCDIGDHCVCVFNVDGKLLSSFGSEDSGVGHVNSPWDVCMDGEGLLFICDVNNSRICVHSVEGAFIREFPTPRKPYCVAATHCNHLVVSSGSSHTVMIMRTSGQFVHEFGGAGGGLGLFWGLSGVAVDNEDCVYVCDGGNSHIQVY